MSILKKTLIVAGALALSTAAFAGHHEGDGKQDKMKAGDAPVMGIPMEAGAAWGIPAETGGTWSILHPFNSWSIFDPYLLDMPSGGKGIPVHDANDATKIIGYVKMPERPKPTGPVHCMIKETGLLAKSVDDCEAAGGTVAK